VVCQIAKLKGLYVVGSAGSDEKVKFLLDELKIDGAFNYNAIDTDKALNELCSNGIDIYYDNVGYVLFPLCDSEYPQPLTTMPGVQQRSDSRHCSQTSQYVRAHSNVRHDFPVLRDGTVRYQEPC
jgi:hypothetical protein